MLNIKLFKGIDLRFPHHDNEIAQSEAYYECNEWVKYFIHTGHLDISGKKMSKSEKNFIQIQEQLKSYTGKQIRLLFLMHKWDTVMNYTFNMDEPKSKDKTLSEFFLNTKAFMRESSLRETQKWDENDFQINEALQATKRNIHKNILDNFSFSPCISEVLDLVAKVNIYMASSNNKKLILIQDIRTYLLHILKVHLY